jgi:FkbM family methyltransferase
MTFTSYAQNLEDVVLFRALKHIEDGFYIDVGANDPREDSVTKAFYDRGWHGINIEPLESHHRDLLAARPRDINLLCAAGAEVGELELWEADTRGWASADSETIAKHREAGHSGTFVRVPVRTLNDICLSHARPVIHFLKIDVEGFELEVIKGIDLKNTRPWIIVVEATLPNSTIENFDVWEGLLTSSNYRFAYSDGINRFYVACEQTVLLQAFKYPPNVLDDYVSDIYVQSVNREHARAEEMAAQVQSTLAEYHKLVGQSNRAIEALNAQAKEHSEQQQVIINQYSRAIAELQGAVDARKSENEALMSSLSDASINVEYWHNRLLEIHASTSWRITRPLSKIFRGEAIAVRPYLQSTLRDTVWRIYRKIASFKFLQNAVQWFFHRFPSFKKKSLAFLNNGIDLSPKGQSVDVVDQITRQHVASLEHDHVLSPKASLVYLEIQTKLADFSKTRIDK